jgi:glyoxylase-like metal-dependent hydrolase (beta-lactamase superfamily II)
MRRSAHVFSGLAFVLAAAALRGQDAAAPSPAAAAGAPTHFQLVPAGEGVWAAIAKEGDPTAGGNAGFVVGTDSVLVVDAFVSTAAADELLAEIRKKTPLPVKWVVNTHYHYDHSGGDATFVRAGASVVAHENERAWVRTENLKFYKEPTAADREKVGSLALPDVTHRDGLTIWLGADRRVDVLARPGHTGGDSVVVVPATKTVFTGDLFWHTTLPNLIDASTDQWITTLDGFLQSFPDSTYVPGHGEIGHALDVRYFRDYLTGLRLSVAKAISEGKSGKDLVDSLMPALKAKYGSWKWFDGFAPRNLEQTEQELKGTKKIPRNDG